MTNWSNVRRGLKRDVGGASAASRRGRRAALAAAAGPPAPTSSTATSGPSTAAAHACSSRPKRRRPRRGSRRAPRRRARRRRARARRSGSSQRCQVDSGDRAPQLGADAAPGMGERRRSRDAERLLPQESVGGSVVEGPGGTPAAANIARARRAFRRGVGGSARRKTRHECARVDAPVHGCRRRCRADPCARAGRRLSCDRPT